MELPKLTNDSMTYIIKLFCFVLWFNINPVICIFNKSTYKMNSLIFPKTIILSINDALALKAGS